MKTINTIMKIVLTFLTGILLVGCATENDQQYNVQNARKMKVRITTYSRNERGSDHWTRRGISAMGTKLKNEKSVAVDPKIIPYGSKIMIPQLGLIDLVPEDTGKFVRSRRASKLANHGEPVIDLFFDKESEARHFRM